MQLWNLNDGEYSLNFQEKSELLTSFGSSSETFCDHQISEETQTVLTEVQALLDEGKTDEASQKLQDYFHKLERELGFSNTPYKLFKVILLDKESTYKYIRDMLSIAGKAELLGLDDLAEDAKNEASNTFDEYGNKTIENVSDLNEAMDIAAQAQLLGLDDLSDIAMDKVRDIAKKMVDEGFSSFDICSATEEDVKILFKLAALSQILGLEGNRDRVDEVIDLAKKWKEIQEKRENGEAVPECDLNFIEIDADFGNPYMHVSGSIITCDGTNWEIEVNLDGSLDGSTFTGQGSITFSLDNENSIETIIPVTGTAKFGDDVLEYQDPLSFRFYLLGDGKSQIMLSSTGQGTMTTPIGPITFAVLPTTESEIIPMSQKDCGN